MSNNHILEKYIEVEKKLQKINDTIINIKDAIDQKIKASTDRAEKEKLYNEFKQTVNDHKFKIKYKKLQQKQKRLKRVLNEIIDSVSDESDVQHGSSLCESTPILTFNPNIDLVDDKLCNMIDFYKEFINEPIVLISTSCVENKNESGNKNENENENKNENENENENENGNKNMNKNKNKQQLIVRRKNANELTNLIAAIQKEIS